MPGEAKWMLLGLRDRETEMRTWAAAYRDVSPQNSLRDLALRIAQAYDKAADVFAAEHAAIEQEVARGG